MEKFDVNLQRKPPEKDILLAINRIQSQTCSCCPPLRLPISEPTMNNRQQAVPEFSKTGKKFLSQYNLLRLFASTHSTKPDALVHFMGTQVNETADSLLLLRCQIQNNRPSIL